MGIGIGILVSAALMMPFRYGTVREYDVELEARKMGMIYPRDLKANEEAAPVTDGAIGE